MTESLRSTCKWCGGEIPLHKRSVAKYCSHTCKSSASNNRNGRKTGRIKGPDRGPRPNTKRRDYAWKKEGANRYNRKYQHMALYGREIPEEEMAKYTSKRSFQLKEYGYRSMLEKRVADQLNTTDVPWGYETEKLRYVWPERSATYTSDFQFEGSNIHIECKGMFHDTAERQKMLLVKEQNPDVDIRFVFQRADKPIYKGSKTTYAQWADKNGFKWAENEVPQEWIDEITATSRMPHPEAP